MGSEADTLVFVTWLWKGWRDIYNERHVLALHRMLDEFAPEHRFYVVSDVELQLPKDVFVYPLWRRFFPPNPHCKADCFIRLKLFDPGFGPRFGRRIVSIDLDTLIQDNMSPLFETSPNYRAVAGVSSYYNGGLWEMRSGTNRHVWDKLFEVPSHKIIERIERAKRKFYRPVSGSDQAWMSMQIEDGELWTSENGVRHYSKEKYLERRKNLDTASVVCFAGGIKPWHSECRRITPNIYKRYMKYYDA